MELTAEAESVQRVGLVAGMKIYAIPSWSLAILVSRCANARSIQPSGLWDCETESDDFDLHTAIS